VGELATKRVLEESHEIQVTLRALLLLNNEYKQVDQNSEGLT
jgi:hypothetical protein